MSSYTYKIRKNNFLLMCSRIMLELHNVTQIFHTSKLQSWFLIISLSAKVNTHGWDEPDKNCIILHKLPKAFQAILKDSHNCYEKFFFVNEKFCHTSGFIKFWLSRKIVSNKSYSKTSYRSCQWIRE